MKTFNEWYQLQEFNQQRDEMQSIAQSLYNSLNDMRQNPQRFADNISGLASKTRGTVAEPFIQEIQRNFGDFCRAVQQRGFSTLNSPQVPQMANHKSSWENRDGGFDEYQRIYNVYAQRNHDTYERFVTAIS